MDVSCSICLEQYTTLSIQSVTKCGHVFHKFCLTPWIIRNKTCPFCRAPTTLSDLMRSYFKIPISKTGPTLLENKAELQRELRLSQDSGVQLRAEVADLKRKLNKANRRIRKLRKMERNLRMQINRRNPSDDGQFLF